MELKYYGNSATRNRKKTTTFTDCEQNIYFVEVVSTFDPCQKMAFYINISTQTPNLGRNKPIPELQGRGFMLFTHPNYYSYFRYRLYL